MAERNEKPDRVVCAVHICSQRRRRLAPRVQETVPGAQGWEPGIQDDRGLETREEKYSGLKMPTKAKARRQEGVGEVWVAEAD